MLPSLKKHAEDPIVASQIAQATPFLNQHDTFLPPIEKPTGFMMKLVYSMTRRQFGKVLTPLKVFGARLPLAFGNFYGKISKLDKKLRLSPETVMLIREQVAHTNVCLFCIDNHQGLDERSQVQ